MRVGFHQGDQKIVVHSSHLPPRMFLEQSLHLVETLMGLASVFNLLEDFVENVTIIRDLPKY